MALEFDGSNDYVDISNESDYDFAVSDPFSLCSWIKTTDSTHHICILSKYSHPDPDTILGYFSSSLNSNGLIQIQSGTLSYKYKHGDSNLADGNWHYVVGTYDGSNTLSGMKVYVDGDEESSYTAGESGTVGTITHNESLKIAIRDTLTPIYFNGIINDARVYNRALSLPEIQTIYHSRGADGIVNGLVGRWLMNEGTDGATASGAGSCIDISKEGNHGTPTNSPIYRASPMKIIKRR